MAASTVGLVYSAATGRLRNAILPDDNGQLTAWRGHAGESIFIIPLSQYQGTSDLAGLQAIVNTHTGLTPSGDRYVSVDANSNVLAVYIADPAAGDAAPQSGATLIAHATAMPRDLLWGGKLFPTSPLTPKHVNRNQPLP